MLGMYVNNSMNRSLGRVGMVNVSMPVSRLGGGGGRSYSGGGGSYGGGGSSYGGDGSSYSSSDRGGNTKTYVDNSSNRSLGRVGMPHGSMPVSRSSGSGNYSSGDTSSKTYVDNSSYRSKVESECHMVAWSFQEVAQVIIRVKHLAVEPQNMTITHTTEALNEFDWNMVLLWQVGLPHGAVVHSINTSSQASPAFMKYVDNAFTRSKGRVGKPFGSMPISRKIREIDFSKMGIDEEQQYEACDVAPNLIHRMEEVMRWQKETSTTHEPHTSDRVLQNYRGTKIDFKDIEIMQKIGSGGFGDVHFAKWKRTVVAAKNLRVQRVSKRRLKEFTDEIFLLCELEHPNIVKFIGASVVTPNLCIVMEYMQMSLFDALHIKDDVEFSEREKIEIIQHTALGLEYLHDAIIAHCDMKSQNVLLDYVAGETLVAKITDFGLSMMKNETETSTSAGGDYVRNIGTPRYSSPENLRGDYLHFRDLMMSDMYSYSLIVFEVSCEEEPFYKLNYPQLRKQVGELGLTPEIPHDVSLHSNVLSLLNKCWDREPRRRPTAKLFAEYALQFDAIYQIN
ncbi:unnamed protein product [Mytilus coruscus]|uniref:Protein kinase domain-containing protein n=1 Tax=Mytilus coruscus TaxID=42192 RepID=A0A6J8F261_MYTCO|nr:unnamed protein product [Mytilus coruscus]